SSEHRRNFLDSVKSRKPTITPVDVAHHSTIPGHLGLISMLVGRKLQWDVANEKILNDPEATALLSRSYRAPSTFPSLQRLGNCSRGAGRQLMLSVRADVN